MGTDGERRLSLRYKVSLVVRFRPLDAKKTGKWHVGRTCDMNTLGVCFQCRAAVPLNSHIEMVMEWPTKHDNLRPIYLRAVGRVVWGDGGKIAVRMSFCRMHIETVIPARDAAASGA
jgi:hypothetical protein